MNRPLSWMKYRDPERIAPLGEMVVLILALFAAVVGVLLLAVWP